MRVSPYVDQSVRRFVHRCAPRSPRTRACLVVLLALTSVVLSSPPSPPLKPTASAGQAARAGTGEPAVGQVWPVEVRPRVLRGWEPPRTPYGRGHRGVDLAATPWTPVRAVAAGRVSFAGQVAGRGVVSVELSGTGTPPLRTTYEPVRPSVRKGAEVAPGEVVGTVEARTPARSPHCAVSCLHWGLLRADVYLDPLTLLPPWLLRTGPPRLLPVLGLPVPE